MPKKSKKTKIMFLLTNHEDLGNTGKKTGAYLPEIAHPYEEFIEHLDYTIEFVSPKGGKVPIDPGSMEKFYKTDKTCTKFFDAHEKALENTLKLSNVEAKNYAMLFIPGGHGPMWDLSNNDEVADLIKKVYEGKGIIGTVCHGVVAFLNVKLSNGEYMVKGKKITSFSNSEEKEVKLESVVPFLLESKLRERGAEYHAKENGKDNVQVSDRIVTGQNPASSRHCATEMIHLIRTQSKD